MIAVMKQITAEQAQQAADDLDGPFSQEEAERMLDDLEDGLPYTQTPNIVIDKIFKLLTDLEKAILLYTIRRTKGFHQDTARISTSQYMRNLNKGRTAINNARRRLVDKGYLIVVERGTGLKATLYRVCLHPEIRAQILRRAKKTVESPNPTVIDNSHQVAKTPNGIDSVGGGVETAIDGPPSSPLPPALHTPASQEPMSPPPSASQDMPPTSPPSSSDVSLDQPRARQLDTADPPSPPAPPDPSPDQTPPVKENQASSEKSTSEAAKIKGDAGTTPQDISIVYIPASEETNTEANIDSPQDKKKAYAAVRFVLRCLSISLVGSDYAFLWWCINNYGASVVMEKANIMRCQMRRGITFTNPLAWLRNALKQNWGYSKNDLQKVKGDERAKSELERTRRDFEQREKHRQLVRAEQDDPEAQARIQALLAEANARLGIEA